METNKKDILGCIKIIFNSILIFFVSNNYMLNKEFNIKIPVLITILVVIFLNIFPSWL